MSISKATYTGRLNPLKFDLPDMADNTAVEASHQLFSLFDSVLIGFSLT